jgi:hypothetical protein
MQEYDQLKQKMEEVEADLRAAEEGNKAAGVRVRKVMQDIKGLAQSIRTKIIELRDSKSGDQ